MARTIRVDYLARVEGEGALTIRFDGDEPKDVELRIFEPPRFFEAFLRGRDQSEAPDLTARICGICPVAYQMSACQAIENAHGIRVDEPTRTLRRLLFCGEWIESHSLHLFMLHAPDFLGFADGVAMARVHPEVVRAGLGIKKAGNAIVRAIGGREVHPINVRVGGFYRAPGREELERLLPELETARAAMRSALTWMAGFSFPDFERDYEFVALSHPSEYAVLEGRITSSRGLSIEAPEYDAHFVEEQVPHSTALHSRLDGRSYFCGPLARINLNFDRLGDEAKQAASDIGFSVPCTNPFKSLLSRGLETLHALDEALRIIQTYERPERPFVELPRNAVTGYGCTEAPRGLLYHRYRLDGSGTITDAKIVPPTSQNQRTIEEDLFAIAGRLGRMPHEQATLLAEQTVRNYDPCISCSTHFLTLEIERA
jgi:coenzyme F420-reducing hydrogenase alpha subunit